MEKFTYEELVQVVSNISDFKKLVQSETKRPIAVRLLKHIANIGEHEAWDFVNEYYDNMDIKFKRVRINDGMFNNRTM